MTIYTVIFNNYDTLKDPRFIDPNVRYVCYSNTPQVSDVWEIIHVDMTEVKDQRKLKILQYQDLDDWTVYIDASIEIKASVYSFAYQWEEDFTVLQHRGRNCIYTEADAVLSLEKDSPEVVHEQIEKYQYERYPRQAGMIQTGLLMRRRNPAVDKFCKAWWKEVRDHSVRDQLSFNYIAWKQAKGYDIIPFTTFEQCFRLHGHG